MSKMLLTLDELWTEIQRSHVESCCPTCLEPMEFEMGLSVRLGTVPEIVSLDSDGCRGIDSWWCEKCGEHIDPLQDDALAEARRARLPREHCGLNADWNSRAWAVTGSLRTDRSVFILDDESPERTFSLAQRIFRDDDNDLIVTLRSGMTEIEASAYLRTVQAQTSPPVASPVPPAAPKTSAGDDCEDEREALPFRDMDPEDLQRELEGITKTYGLWVLEVAKSATSFFQNTLQQSMDRAMRHRVDLAFCDRRHTPRVGDKVITLNGDNDCDENDLPRVARPGTEGEVVAQHADKSVHVIFNGGCWVSLELYEICDPTQYTWEP